MESRNTTRKVDLPNFAQKKWGVWWPHSSDNLITTTFYNYFTTTLGEGKRIRREAKRLRVANFA